MSQITPNNLAFSADGVFTVGGSVTFGFDGVPGDPESPVTLKPIYIDKEQTIAALNPQPLDGDGKYQQSATGILYGSGTYSVLVKNSANEQVSYNPSYNSGTGTASEVNVGTGPDEVPLNSDIGLGNGEENYSTGNLNQLVFGGIVGARFGQGIATSASTVTMNLPMDLFGDITSAAFEGSYSIINPLEFTFGTVNISNINFDAIASTGRCLCFTVGGLSGLTARDPVTMECVDATSKITVTV